MVKLLSIRHIPENTIAYPNADHHGQNQFSPLPESLVRYSPPIKKKSLFLAYVLALSPLGLLGAHHFYLKRRIWGKLYACTLGLLGVGYFVDWFRIPELVREYNYPHKRKQLWKVSEAYMLWLPFGLLGFHQYYLGNGRTAIRYTFSLGGLGIAWIRDLYQIPTLVKMKNEDELILRRTKKNIYTAYLYCITGGFFGIHHWYLNRSPWSVGYQLSLGVFGLGWVLDLIRMPWLVSRANDEIIGKRSPETLVLEEAYLLWLTLGLLGAHNFYLNRPGWGVLYIFTLGFLGIGWLIDAVRIPKLVKDYNEELTPPSPTPAVATTPAVAITSHAQVVTWRSGSAQDGISGIEIQGMSNPSTYL
ncbi:uncharacterized protein LOC131951020 [Physella acuta]|uniref:uncharacterized protein LOC131951020 n=1 Tax=Physella acuta TaxID=109671 RepID=UPI0027DAD4DD|nr:uncharacterized protein LOC131951020 [Physella acuta]